MIYATAEQLEARRAAARRAFTNFAFFRQPHTRWPEEVMAVIQLVDHDGVPMTKTAPQLGLSLTRVRRICHDWGHAIRVVNDRERREGWKIADEKRKRVINDELVRRERRRRSLAQAAGRPTRDAFHHDFCDVGPATPEDYYNGVAS